VLRLNRIRANVLIMVSLRDRHSRHDMRPHSYFCGEQGFTPVTAFPVHGFLAGGGGGGVWGGGGRPPPPRRAGGGGRSHRAV
jgi:hypothetical protein